MFEKIVVHVDIVSIKSIEWCLLGLRGDKVEDDGKGCLKVVVLIQMGLGCYKIILIYLEGFKYWIGCIREYNRKWKRNVKMV